ncbi:uncharacterized protein LOC141835637 [Curcuma longa]|uniref:uncharacterized protein LOC141835637 n=1 Tax=Curcuma longa TaxID=136217 RepID=UPI003D9DB9B7
MAFTVLCPITPIISSDSPIPLNYDRRPDTHVRNDPIIELGTKRKIGHASERCLYYVEENSGSTRVASSFPLSSLSTISKKDKASFQDLLQKQNGERALWEYPFAVAGVNITFMLIQMLDLQLAKPRSFIAAVFLKLLSENDQAFDIMYCITFKLMDHQWLTMHASYMDFNIVMKSTRRRLEQELLLKSVNRIEDLPSYRLLAR